MKMSEAKRYDRLAKWVPDGIKEGDGRNDTLMRGICALQRLGHDDATIWNAAIEKNKTFKPPMDDRELVKLVSYQLKRRKKGWDYLYAALQWFNERQMFPTVDQFKTVTEIPSGNFRFDFSDLPRIPVLSPSKQKIANDLFRNLVFNVWKEYREKGDHLPVIIDQETQLLKFSEWKFIIENTYNSEMATPILDAKYFAERGEAKQQADSVLASIFTVSKEEDRSDV